MLDKATLKRRNPRSLDASPSQAVQRFQAGDLITAEMLNRLVDAIAALEARVAALEARQH